MMTSNPDPTLERIARRIPVPQPASERLLRRRDRKRRNQRIAAGVVGIAMFVAVVWIVWDVASLDRSETSVIPGGSSTTGPAETGPAETGPRQIVAPDPPDEWNGSAIPPEGTVLSTPVEGQPILQQDYEAEYLLGRKVKRCHGGCGKWYHTHLVVYADGRVLWWEDLRGPGDANGPGGGDYVLERRLTPEGVDLVTSGVEPEDLADSTWADAAARPYAPPRYSICFYRYPDEPDDPSDRPLLRAVDMLPEPIRAQLRGGDPDPLHPGCLIVTTSDARAFYDILSEMGLDPAWDLHGTVSPGDTVGSWVLRDAEPISGAQAGVYLRPLWPDGDWHAVTGA